MKDDQTRVFELTLTGQLSLDFVNTVDWRASEQPDEFINSYSDLVWWGQHAGIFDDAQASIRKAARRPVEARAALERVLAFRETLFRIFSSIIDEQSPRQSDVMILNGKLAEALAHRRLVPASAGQVWTWSDTGKGSDDVDRMVWSIARAAGELLTSPNLKQLRKCDGAKCSWLFLDTSRNGSRRWCNMSVCGNRAKVHRFYQQRKVGIDRRESTQAVRNKAP